MLSRFMSNLLCGTGSQTSNRNAYGACHPPLTWFEYPWTQLARQTRLLELRDWSETLCEALGARDIVSGCRSAVSKGHEVSLGRHEHSRITKRLAPWSPPAVDCHDHAIRLPNAHASSRFITALAVFGAYQSDLPSLQTVKHGFVKAAPSGRTKSARSLPVATT
jgi:hypothetical protein